MTARLKNYLPLALPVCGLLLLFLAAGLFRPLLPVDETRYMTVAWEMANAHGWFKPLTLNGESYHHKPPMLFWLINLSWAVFGVHRWAGLVPPLLAALGNVWLVGILGRMLFPAFPVAKARLMMVASLPLLIYGTLVMFDTLLSFSVLLTLVFMVRFARGGRWRDAAIMGVGIGLGLLVKGPVILLHTGPVMLLAPLWHVGLRKRRYYAGCGLAILIGATMILGWLVPVLSSASDNQFAFWLVWNQTAGRVTGNFSDAHVHPFYFYLPMIPVLFLPWLFFPGVWRDLRALKPRLLQDHALRFMLCWMVPVLVGFSLIRGKQPHYLIPLVPGVILLLAATAGSLSDRRVRIVAAIMIGLFSGGQAIADRIFLSAYDLRPIARMVESEPQRTWAFTPNYHGELGFLARLQKPMAEPHRPELRTWLAADPERRAVVRFKTSEDIAGLEPVMTMKYRSGNIGIFRAP